MAVFLNIVVMRRRYAVSTGKYLPTFRLNVMPYSSGPVVLRWFIGIMLAELRCYFNYTPPKNELCTRFSNFKSIKIHCCSHMLRNQFWRALLLFYQLCDLPFVTELFVKNYFSLCVNPSTAPWTHFKFKFLFLIYQPTYIWIFTTVKLFVNSYVFWQDSTISGSLYISI